MTSRDESTDFNKAVGRNVQELRKAAGISQATLAERLSEHGYQFRQQTILKIEKGSRPLKLDEAVAIALELQVPTELLWDEPLVIDDTAVLTSHTEAVSAAWGGVLRAVRELADRMEMLRSSIESVEKSKRRKRVPKGVLAMARGHLTIDLEKTIMGAIRERDLEMQIRNAQYDYGVAPVFKEGHDGQH